MSKKYSAAIPTKVCEIFLRSGKGRAETASTPQTKSLPAKAKAITANVGEDATMANIGDVLKEIKLLRADFGSKLDNIETRVTTMASTLAAVENKITAVQQEVSSNTTRMEEAESRIVKAEETLDKTETELGAAIKRISYLESKVIDQENRSRRKNLRLGNLGPRAEGQQTLFDFINEKLPQWMGLGPDESFTLERVHRTMASGKPDQNRVVLIRFLKFQEKEMVFRQSKQMEIKHDGIKLTFKEDLSAETVKLRQGFNSITQLFVNIGAFRGFQLHPCKLRVLHNGKIHLFSTPQDAEEFYNNVHVEPPAVESTAETAATAET